ncbi:hypothetical protein CPB86DRAFT_793473 [Serendipita vermifera]|nr:hypothetical protein CPB86DRAFT_793473 [Serendipita vermifera]
MYWPGTCRMYTILVVVLIQLAHYVPSKQFALDLEQQLDDHNYDSIFNSLSRLEVFSIASFYLLTSSPLVSLSDINIDLYNRMENHTDLNRTSSRLRNIDSTDKPVAALSRKVTSVFQRNPSLTASKKKESRDQIMESILYRVPNEYRKQVGELILLWRCKLLEEDDTVALTQIVGSQSILEDMIKKWDFDLWRPLPTGVERRRTVEGDWVVS